MKKAIIIMLILVLLLMTACSSAQDQVSKEAEAQNEDAAIDEDADDDADVTDDDIDTSTDTDDDIDADTNNSDTNIKSDESPVSVLTKAEIAAIGADGFTGTDEEIAISILNWQKDNMIYAGFGTNYTDVSYSMRWNYAFPNIYTSKDMLENMRDGNRYYGICYNYAVIYASIAEYYGLEVRITNTVEKLSEVSDNPLFKMTADGMHEDEHKEFIKWIKSKGMNEEDYPYEAVNLVMAETSMHYRAEVLINGEWKRMDKYLSNTNDSEADQLYTFVLTDWNEGNRQEEFENYVQRIKNGEDIRGAGEEPSAYNQFLEGRSIRIEMNELENYVGITDDLGNKNRAANMGDLMQGYGLVPYFNNKEDVIKFFNNMGPINEVIEELFDIKKNIEDNSNEKFFVICNILIIGRSESVPEDVYLEQYYGFTGETISSNSFNSYIE